MNENASQNEIGVTFLILGGTYMVASPIMGYVSISICTLSLYDIKVIFDDKHL